jgi:hypothetical protein
MPDQERPKQFRYADLGRYIAARRGNSNSEGKTYPEFVNDLLTGRVDLDKNGKPEFVEDTAPQGMKRKKSVDADYLAYMQLFVSCALLEEINTLNGMFWEQMNGGAAPQQEQKQTETPHMDDVEVPLQEFTGNLDADGGLETKTPSPTTQPKEDMVFPEEDEEINDAPPQIENIGELAIKLSQRAQTALQVLFGKSPLVMNYDDIQTINRTFLVENKPRNCGDGTIDEIIKWKNEFIASTATSGGNMGGRNGEVLMPNPAGGEIEI